MGMAAPAYYTADMVRALPQDSNRYEVVHGELLVTPAPRVWHQELSARLLAALRNYLDRERVGVVLASPAVISWGRSAEPPAHRSALGKLCTSRSPVPAA
jgi:Uma2 family endonuclease